MKEKLLWKLVCVALSLFSILPVSADAASPKHHEMFKQRFKSAENSGRSLLSLVLYDVSQGLRHFAAPDEVVVEYPDSTIVFSASGEKVYITRFGYDERKRMNYKVEYAKSDAAVVGSEWVKTVEETVKYDESDRAVYNEFYKLIEGVWTGTSKAALEYDGYGNQSVKEQYRWNVDERKWENGRKEISDYREDGQVNFTENYYGYGDVWEGEYKEAFTYNESGLRTKYQDYEWDEGEWILVAYTDYIYDENKPALLVTEMEYEQDYDTGEMLAYGKGEYTYDENDLKKETLWMAWDEGEWVNDMRLFYEYTHGIATKEDGYGWDGRDWVFRQKWEGEYDAEGRQLKSRFYYPDATTKDPVLSSVYTYEYNANGNRTLFLLETRPYDGSSNELIVMTKEIARFDDASRQTLSEKYGYNYITGFEGVSKEEAEYTGYENNVAWFASYIWKDGAWFPYLKEVNGYEDNIHKEVLRYGAGATADEWAEQAKYLFSYNENNSMLRQDYYVKNAAGDWVLDTYLLYYYPVSSGIGTTESTVARIYAADGLLNISGIGKHTSVRIYNLSGQMVHAVTALGESLILSLPQGLYLVSIGGNTVKVCME